MDASDTAMNITRPPHLSVSEPMTIRPSDPTRMGVATSIDAWVLDRRISPAYVVESGPIMFQAQKLIAETHVASTRFFVRAEPVVGSIAAFTPHIEPPNRHRSTRLGNLAGAHRFGK